MSLRLLPLSNGDPPENTIKGVDKSVTYVGHPINFLPNLSHLLVDLPIENTLGINNDGHDFR